MLTGIVGRVHVSVLGYLQEDKCSSKTKDTEQNIEIVQESEGFITVSGIISTLDTSLYQANQCKGPLKFCLMLYSGYYTFW